MKATVEDLLCSYEEYLAKLGRSLVTQKNYLSLLKLFKKWFEKKSPVKRVNLTKVKEIDLLSYRNYLQHSKR